MFTTIQMFITHLVVTIFIYLLSLSFLESYFHYQFFGNIEP